MCNLPCKLCGDYDECEIRYKDLIDFEIYSKKGKCGECSLTREQAEEFSFINPELTLISIESDSLIN